MRLHDEDLPSPTSSGTYGRLKSCSHERGCVVSDLDGNVVEKGAQSPVLRASGRRARSKTCSSNDISHIFA